MVTFNSHYHLLLTIVTVAQKYNAQLLSQVLYFQNLFVQALERLKKNSNNLLKEDREVKQTILLVYIYKHILHILKSMFKTLIE